MDDTPEQETISIDRLIALIDQTHEMAKKVAKLSHNNREAALSLMQAIKQLEIANHFANSAKTLEEQNNQ